MSENRFSGGICVALWFFMVGGCAPERSATEASRRATSLPASVVPNLERFEDLSQGRPVSAKTDSGRVDAYLAWLRAFEAAKLQTNTQLAERLKATAQGRVSNNNEPALETDPGHDNARSAEATLAALKEVTDTTEKIAITFRSRPEAPPECETLADLYATALSKNLGALQRIARQRAADVQAVGQGNYPGRAARAADIPADNGAAEMADANQELQRLFQRYPKLKTTPFQFAF